MSYRGGHGRGSPGGLQQKPRGGGGGGGGMNFQNDVQQQQQQQQQQFGFQQRGFQPQMMHQQPGLQLQQQPQPIQIPTGPQGSRSFMSGMPSPSLAQSASMPMMGYQGTGSSTNATRMPFDPPLGPVDQGQKSHHDILRKHQEEYALKQSGHMAMNQAHQSTPGTYVGMSSKHNNSVVPVLPRLSNPYQQS